MNRLGVLSFPGVVRPEWPWVDAVLRYVSRLFAPRSGGATMEPGKAAAPQANDPDAELLVAVLAEYPHATQHFRVLMEKYWPGVWKMCQAILLNEQDAEDAAQRTFLKVHRHLHSFRFESWFAPWIRRIAVSFGARLGGMKTFGSSGSGNVEVFSVKNIVVVMELNDYNVMVELRAWIHDERNHIALRLKLRESMYEALRNAGVDMPFETLKLEPVEVSGALQTAR